MDTTGQLGGFGVNVLGAAPENGDLENGYSPARHYRFHEGSGTTANDEYGGPALTSSGIDSAVPTFASTGDNFTSALFPLTTATWQNYTNAELIDGASSGAWETLLASGGSIEFWFAINNYPVITDDNSATIGGVFYAGTVEYSHILSIGDPTLGTPPLCIAVSYPAYPGDSSLVSLSVLLLNTPSNVIKQVTFILDNNWHHLLLTWSASSTATKLYLDGALSWSEGALPPAITSGAQLRVGYNEYTTLTGLVGNVFTVGGVEQSISYIFDGASFSIEDLAIYGRPIDVLPGTIYDVSASNSISLTGTAAEPIHWHVFNVAATTDFVVATSVGGVIHVPTSYSVAASNSFVMAGSASAYDAHAVFVSATSSIALHAVALIPREWSVAASTAFFVGGLGSVATTALYVSATTSIFLTPVASEYAWRNYNVSAVSGIILSPVASEYAWRSYSVEASNSFVMADVPSLVANRLWSVSASNSIAVGSSVTVIHNYVLEVAAVTGLILAGSSFESADFSTSAQSGFVLAPLPTACRDIYVSATTSVGLGEGTIKGNMKIAAASSGVIIACSSTRIVTGTEAETMIVLTHLATATTWIPWRRTSLSLNPGGNLPHS